MNRPLILTAEIRARIDEIREHAEQNVEPLSSLVRRMDKPERAPGAVNFDATTIIIPMGYRCCFTMEQQPKGDCRHLSISVPEPSKVPNEFAILEIMRAFGFDDPKVNPVMMYAEEFGDGKAMNIIQRINKPSSDATPQG